MIWALGLFAIGLILSAFFSGSETGLYRVSRTRLILDGLAGSRSTRGVIWLLNHPAIFVATTLVGNNVANYMTSFAIVMATSILFGTGTIADLLGPMLMTPMIFVLGELLPKYLFFHSPYRLLTALRPFLLLATVVFAPISLLLGLLGNLLQKVTGETPFRLRLAMARRELDQVLQAGHEAGILAARQTELATKLFEIGNQPAIRFGVPTDRLAVVGWPIDEDEALQKAARANHPIILVGDRGRITGFVRYLDVLNGTAAKAIRPVVRANSVDSHLKVLLRLYDAASDVAVLFDHKGDATSVVTRRQLALQLTKF